MKGPARVDVSHINRLVCSYPQSAEYSHRGSGFIPLMCFDQLSDVIQVI